MTGVFSASLASLPPDGRLLLAARGLRLFATGFVSVILAVFLAELGLPPPLIGVVFTATLAGSAALTIVVAAVGDRIGRRRLLMTSGVLVALSGLVFAVTVNVTALMVTGFVSILSPGGGDVGSSLALDQAALAQSVRPGHRTGVFAWGSLIALAASAVGALAAGLPPLAERVGVGTLDACRLMFGGYAACGLVLLVLFAGLSPAVELGLASVRRRSWRELPLHRSRGTIARFAALLALNSFATDFVDQSFVAYWFYAAFGADAATLGGILFLTNVAGAMSYLGATRIAERICLVNTMVWTHLPSNILLMLVPLMPTLWLAATILVLRHVLSQMDRPARESYTMAIVAPDERRAAASLISIATDAAAAIALAVVGVVSQLVTPGAFFVVAGLLRCVYNGALLGLFRHIRPPEEAHRTRSSG